MTLERRKFLLKQGRLQIKLKMKYGFVNFDNKYLFFCKICFIGENILSYES